MREIEFRGQTGNGRWIYGSLVYSESIQPAIYFEDGRGEVKTMDWAYVKPDTVGQFTGLCDKNGKKIYEGDILSVNRYVNAFMDESCDFRNAFDIDDLKGEFIENITGIVDYEEGAFFVNNLYLSSLFGNQKHSNPIHEFEVIGNIHDNPELLNNI